MPHGVTNLHWHPSGFRKNSDPQQLKFGNESGAVAQLVRVPDCRSGGCGFKSRRPRLQSRKPSWFAAFCFFRSEKSWFSAVRFRACHSYCLTERSLAMVRGWMVCPPASPVGLAAAPFADTATEGVTLASTGKSTVMAAPPDHRRSFSRG